MILFVVKMSQSIHNKQVFCNLCTFICRKNQFVFGIYNFQEKAQTVTCVSLRMRKNFWENSLSTFYTFLLFFSYNEVLLNIWYDQFVEVKPLLHIFHSDIRCTISKFQIIVVQLSLYVNIHNGINRVLNVSFIENL